MDSPLINIVKEIKNKTTSFKPFVLLISVYLALPLSARAASIHYSVTGTSIENPTNEIRDLTGHMVISDEPHVTNPFPTNSDSVIHYQIESYTLILEDIGSISGTGFIRFEEYRWGFAELHGIGGSRQVDNPYFFQHIQYYDSDGSPYGSPDDTSSFANYAELAPLITSSGVTDHFGDYYFNNYASFNITLNAVPVPAAVWLFGSGLIGLIGVARRKKS